MTWTVAPLGEITRVLGGTTPDPATAQYWGGEHVWVTPTDLGKLRTWKIEDSGRRLTNAGIKSCNLPLVPASSIVMSSRAPIGHLAVAGCDLFTNQGCKSFVCSPLIDHEFLFLSLRYRMTDIQTLGSGATFVEVSKSALEAFEIAFPDINQQRRIASRLKAQLTAVEDARQAAQAQLNEIRLLKIKALSAVFGRIAETSPIGNVAKVQSGFAFKSQEFRKQGIRLLRNANIYPGRVYWDDATYLSPDDAGKFSSYALNEGDVLISLDRPIISSGIKVARVGSVDLPALLVQRVGRFQMDKARLDADYFYAYLQTKDFINAISGHDQSLGVPHISPAQVETVKIPLPKLDVQKRLALTVSEIIQASDAAIESAEHRLSDIAWLPSRLLAQAFENITHG